MTLLEDAAAATLRAFEAGPDLVYQPAFFDGEFFGYADFVENTPDGWLVCDAKLARHAKPEALLQVAAYSNQLERLGLPRSRTVSLLLGSGERADFPVEEVLPVFREHAGRLRVLLHSHIEGGEPVRWGTPGVRECGRCDECLAAVERTQDVLLVAGLRLDQRAKLRDAGVTTVSELAVASSKPAGMSQTTFDKLKDQASLQAQTLHGGPAAPMHFKLTDSAAETLSKLPAPSEGDLFFDFEGDPLHNDGDPSKPGLEYLWGMIGPDEKYIALWAHDSAEERAAFAEFMRLVAERRAAHPDMHVYHYAPYETTALKRLAVQYQMLEDELDDLLRGEVFVDLYATVRGSVQVSAPSYSIKKLEPLYMGDQLRSGEEDAVADGGASVVAFHEYSELRRTDPVAAEKRRAALADYNEYDCVSTLRLRDWLLERAVDAGVREQIVPHARQTESEEEGDAEQTTELFRALMRKAGPDERTERSPEQQMYAMLAATLGYHRREDKQFWWERYARLDNPIEDWADSRDVFVVESAVEVQRWEVPGGRARNARRQLELTGDWAPGSKSSSSPMAVYPVPGPPKSSAPDLARYATASTAGVVTSPDSPRRVLLTESRNPEETFDEVPVALVPGEPPRTGALAAALTELCEHAVDSASPPDEAAFDLLLRRAPRMTADTGLPKSGATTIDNVSDALLGMSNSYVAVQGPPGTGKTYTGARVVKRLVEDHGWRIGVVAQSHAVVENMLEGVVKAGLDKGHVGKEKRSTGQPNREPAWTVPTSISSFVGERDGGFVIGGTAWTFANPKKMGRRSLDLLIVDEAGQLSLAQTLAASVAAERLLLLGDPQQLPQVSKGTHPEPVDLSVLSWLMEGRPTLRDEYGYFLGESYRMHPDLCERVSGLSYEGRLHSAEPAQKRSLEGRAPGVEVVEVEHTGNRTESVEEASEVVEQVKRHLGLGWRGSESSQVDALDEKDFLVVAPYNAQVECVRNALRRQGLPNVRVGTVDNFQGQEAPIVIVSMAASSHEEVPRGMDFLLNRNRINVAISRAQWRAVVIRSRTLTSFLPNSTTGVMELGAFLRLAE